MKLSNPCILKSEELEFEIEGEYYDRQEEFLQNLISIYNKRDNTDKWHGYSDSLYVDERGKIYFTIIISRKLF